MFNAETILLPTNGNNLSLENHVIGYQVQGESTVVLLKKGDNVVFSMVIDSYQQSINATIDILKSNNINSLDFLVWTHPHEDHSEGIEILLEEYCNKNTKVIIPNIDTSSFNNIPINCKKKYDMFSKINEKGRKLNGELIYGERDVVIKRYNLVSNNESADLTICCLSPSSSLLANDKFNKSSNLNDFSVVLCVIFSGIYFVYGADMENKAINILNNNNIYLENVAFVKAPHHGSKSTSKIFDVIEIKENTICTITNYKNGDIFLPDKSILNMYSDRSNELYLFNNEDNDYGVVSSTFDLDSKKNQLIYDIAILGGAYKYCSKE